MPFIPHTEADVKAMLDAIGVDSIERLFEEIPAELRSGRLMRVPEGLKIFLLALAIIVSHALGPAWCNLDIIQISLPEG